jgi:hypothetical protein
MSRVVAASEPWKWKQNWFVLLDIARSLGRDLRSALFALERSLQRRRELEEARTNGTGITSEQYDTLVYLIDSTVEDAERTGLGHAYDLREWHDYATERTEGLSERLADPLTGHIVGDVAIDLAEWLYRFLTEALCCQQDFKALEEEVKVLRQQLAGRPRTTTVTVPAQTVKVHSDLQREILRLMAVEGLGRSWRIIESITATGLGRANSVRNGFRKLAGKGLIDSYRRDARPVSWKPTIGGNRRLWVLTELGESFCREVYGREPEVSEVVAAAQKHTSVEHGIGILEARDHLRNMGHVVDDDPAAILRDADERWSSRVEADLLLTMESEVWPVEVQREVHERTLGKWKKALSLTGRLVIVLFNERKRERQRELLTHCQELPRGSRILLISLEALEADDRTWTTIPVR